MRRLVLFAWLVSAPSGYGWGVEGHRVIARLAAQHLTPAAAARVSEILGPNNTMASVSSWADQVRNTRKETAPWHYVDIPITKPRLDMQRDCADRHCVVAMVEQFRNQLTDKNLTEAQRKEALMFLIHFIGDMHQPLHCSDNKDKGGNDVRIEFFGRPSNLHSLWDSGLLARMGTEEELFNSLSKDLTAKQFRKFSKGNVRNWADQSHREGQLVVYGKLPREEGTVKLSADYELTADPVVKEQLERAGARLAKVLNASFK